MAGTGNAATQSDKTAAASKPSGRSTSPVQGGVWMLILAVLLAWVPVLGPFIAGLVGGRMVGDEKRALGVALIPAIILGAIVWVILAAFEIPVLGAVVGFGALVVVAVQELPLLVGAWLGGGAAGGRRLQR